MIRSLMVLFFVLLTASGFCQTKPWVRFMDDSTGLSGYKDLSGNIQITARYGPLMGADTFHHIIAVDDQSQSYYLLKDGRKAGIDSVYVFDYTFDCETEERILFRDYKKDKVGFLDTSGTVAIPALYDEASPFVNGVALALRHARKTPAHPDGEHMIWQGGEWVLIDKRNRILAVPGNFPSGCINWYSMRTDIGSGTDTSLLVRMTGSKGQQYYFVDYEKEFRKWFRDQFLTDVANGSDLRRHMVDTIVYWQEPEGWTRSAAGSYLEQYSDHFSPQRFKENGNTELSIGEGLFNPFIFLKEQYGSFYNACGNHRRDKYPVFDVVFTRHRGTGQGIYQDHYAFIRTDSGYRLFTVSTK